MGQSDATFRHHLDEVAEAQFKCDVPSHTQNDDLLVKVPSLEQILCRGRFRHPGSYRRIPSPSAVCTRTSSTSRYDKEKRRYQSTARRMTSGSNCLHLNRRETDGARSIGPAYQTTPAKLQHCQRSNHLAD